MMRQEMTMDGLRLLGGTLCLDFVNTVDTDADRESEDFLTSYADLPRWGRHVGVLTEAVATRLIVLGAGRETEAREALTQALAFRRTLHRVFLAVAMGDHPGDADLERTQAAYTHAIARARLIASATDGRFGWEWDSDPATTFLDRMLWPVAASAIDLLTSGDPRRIKVCANPHRCGWLFHDGSKNGSRRWCSMEGCGSQVKMRRHYAKRRAMETSKERERQRAGKPDCVSTDVQPPK